MKTQNLLTTAVAIILSGFIGFQHVGAQTEKDRNWTQWRGNSRDGFVKGKKWPDKIDEKHLVKKWAVELGEGYPGPIVVNDKVFVAETKDKTYEVVRALDRKTGKQIWEAKWLGSMKVPFFARANGDWIRATPAYDNGKLFVAGMKDLLVCLNAKDGKELWRIDFPSKYGTKNPDFGFVSSPLCHEDYVYVQAGGGFCKIKQKTGEVVWRVMKDGGGMYGSAFSSPYITTLDGQEQILVQSRSHLAGVNMDDGKILWQQAVPNFRGMNILTPTVYGGSVFTSSYGQGTFLYNISKDGNNSSSQLKWKNRARGYMTSPIIYDGHAYFHLQNQCFICIYLKDGKTAWQSKRFGKYASLVAQRDRILALDQRGELILLKATPEKFEVLGRRKVSDQETWGHLTVCGGQVFIRELRGITMYEWKSEK